MLDGQCSTTVSLRFSRGEVQAIAGAVGKRVRDLSHDDIRGWVIGTIARELVREGAIQADGFVQDIRTRRTVAVGGGA